MSSMTHDYDGAFPLEPRVARRVIKELCGLNDENVDAFIEGQETNVLEWRPKQVESQAEEERLLNDLARVVRRLEKYYEPNETRDWLTLPHPQLNGERAINVIRAGRTVEILNIIKRLDDAVYL
mgnify:CR=1 FL=1